MLCRRHYIIILTLIVLSLWATYNLWDAKVVRSGDAQSKKKAPTASRLGELSAELVDRANKDQQARFRLTDWAKENGVAFGSKEFIEGAGPLLEAMSEIDAESRSRIAAIIDEIGWPIRSMVGDEAAHAAFLLVQHANHDPALQKRCLELMKQAPEGEVAKEHLALLTDRVFLAEGKPQRYGTQVEFKDGRWQCLPVDEEEHLDERRRKMGLQPIANYLQTVSDTYGTQSR